MFLISLDSVSPLFLSLGSQADLGEGAGHECWGCFDKMICQRVTGSRLLLRRAEGWSLGFWVKPLYQ